jgi:hypothetical protein
VSGRQGFPVQASRSLSLSTRPAHGGPALLLTAGKAACVAAGALAALASLAAAPAVKANAAAAAEWVGKALARI